jgi:alcohol dehydrogenase class IV
MARIQLLRQECERIGYHGPLIVTDPGVKAAGVLQRALDALPGLPVAVFDQTPSNPTEAAVRAATAVFHAQQLRRADRRGRRLGHRLRQGRGHCSHA